MSAWGLTQLTTGSLAGVFHSHSYYDINVFDDTSRYVLVHRMGFAERTPLPDDAVEIGCIDVDQSGSWMRLGESRAWSWQQGPLAQWLSSPRRAVWNDRDGDRFVARVCDLETHRTTTLPRPVYAVDPQGQFALSLNMARLDTVRPGYGYCAGGGALLDQRRPREDGVWRMDLHSGEHRLILSLARATRLLFQRLGWRERVRHLRGNYVYWFNHAKVSPDGKRFTVKLRFRERSLRTGWNDQMGASLTCGTDGENLRLLAHGTSHVIWLNNQRLYFWQRDGVYLYEDREPVGARLGQLAPELITQNVHIRHLPGQQNLFVLDTPYQEEIDLLLYDSRNGSCERMAGFENHRPSRGQYRCDLHPCPSPDARKVVVSSLHDGGRQVYVLRR